MFPYLSIIIFIAILYYPSFECHFKTEDFTLIEDAKNNFSFYNSFVTEFFSPQFYRPITRRVFFSISYALFALNPTGYRIINSILFILNSFLVYEIASILTKRKDVALLASIFYLTRAANLIAIYWITVGFQDNGVAFFVLCTVLLYLQYSNSENKIFYISGLICSICALLSKEISIILPALILLIELYAQTSKRRFNLKILIGRFIPFFILTLIIYLPRIYILRPLILDSPYKMQFSISVFLENIAYYVFHSFNNYLEIFLLGTLSLLAFLKSENRKFAFFLIVWFLIGLLPQLFLTEHPRPYYLNISLVGCAILLSLGMNYLCEKVYTMKYLFIIALLSICMISARITIHTSEYVKKFYEYEKFINSIVSNLKNAFPSFPDNSLIYIRNVSPDMVWLLGYGSVISLHYNNKLAVYFEGSDKKLSEKYSRTYYFKYEPGSYCLTFMEEGLK
jgi:hypothetical protein